jgi:hypothetical protein
MFFQTVLVSLLLILLGLALSFGGYRFFVVLVSIWGFSAGFQFGATIFTNIFGQGFLSTVSSWVVGLLAGLTAAALAYLFYAAAVIMLAGLVGYQLGIGIMAGFGVAEGWLTFLVGLLVGVALVALALYLHLPKLLIVILTALAGAATMLAGVFVALGRISLESLRTGAVGAILRDSWWWGLLFLAIAAVGFYFQWRTTQSYFVEEYTAENPFTTAGTVATVEATAVEEVPAQVAAPVEAAAVDELPTAASTAAAPELASANGATPAADLPPVGA